MGISLSGVGFTYLPGTPMSREVLSSVDLQLDAGEILCLAGRTGAGKSTLVQVMCGLLQASCGRVMLDGQDAAGRSGMQGLRNATGVLLQSSQQQLFAETVQKDVAFGPRNRGQRGEGLAASVREALTSVGMDPAVFSGRSPFSLSGGEMRRAALAGVLAMRPRYLLLDEPSCGLDLPGRELLYRVLEKQRAHGVGILLVSHDWEEIELLADRVALLSQGVIPLAGTKEKVLTSVDDLAAAGMQPPALVTVLAELRKRGLDLPHILPSPAEAAALICEAMGG